MSIIILTVVPIGKSPWLTSNHGPDHLPSRKREGSTSLIRQDSVESLMTSKHKRSVNVVMETLLGLF